MMLRLTVPSLLVAVAIVTGAAGPAAAQNDAEAICNTAISAYVAAVASGDPANVAARFATDGTFNTPQGIFQGRSAIAQYDMGVIKPGAKDSDTLKVARYVDGAVLCSGGFTFTLAPGGPVKEIGGNWTKVLTKSRNGWLMADLSINYAPPPMPPNH
jgi:uncharacterized protein (TIGR02246 family)